jgi:hypothetical protein
MYLTRRGRLRERSADVSWANQYTGNELSTADVSLLSRVLNLAQRSAESLETIYGPVSVYGRAVLEAWNAAMPERQVRPILCFPCLPVPSVYCGSEGD